MIRSIIAQELASPRVGVAVRTAALVYSRPAMVALLAIFLTGALTLAQPSTLVELKRSFENPPDDARIMVRWWWVGPAVTKPELEREMRLMKQGGIGGFEVQPTYALELDSAEKGIKNLPYMSPEFLEALRFTGEKAKELGLRMDLTLGSGWPFGGPHIPVDLASPRLRVARAAVTAGAAAINIPELQPGEKMIAAFLGNQELQP